MKQYQYQILRYLPDRLSGEFINLGIVMYNAEKRQLRSKFYPKTNRLHAFFPSTNARHIIRIVKALETALYTISQEMQLPLFVEVPTQIIAITASVLPKDDSALFFTEPAATLDISIDAAFYDLYERFTLKNVAAAEEQEFLADREVWKQLYKAYFDEYNITPQLHPKQVKTSMDTWNFERTVQNGVLHCFEPVSFNLSDEEYIKRKTYTWTARVQELSTSKDKIHLYLLAALPEDAKLRNFVTAKLKRIETETTIIELVDAAAAESTAKKVKAALENHQ